MNCTVHRRDPEILIDYCAGSLEGERAAQNRITAAEEEDD